MNKNNTAAKILALEMELNLAEQDSDVLSADLAYLERLSVVVSHNINFLKKEAKIVVAAEYKKSVIELSHIGTKLISLQNQIVKIDKSIESKMVALEFYYSQLEIENEIEDKKVLLFRGKND